MTAPCAVLIGKGVACPTGSIISGAMQKCIHRRAISRFLLQKRNTPQDETLRGVVLELWRSSLKCDAAAA
jgi:hypothetical protein